MKTLLLVLDLLGTFVFALSGAAAELRTGSISLGSWFYRLLRPIPVVSPAIC